MLQCLAFSMPNFNYVTNHSIFYILLILKKSIIYVNVMRKHYTTRALTPKTNGKTHGTNHNTYISKDIKYDRQVSCKEKKKRQRIETT